MESGLFQEKDQAAWNQWQILTNWACCPDGHHWGYYPSAQSLTHWGRDKMAAILHMTFSNAFSWMKIYEFLSTFPWSLFLRIQSTIFALLVQIMSWCRANKSQHYNATSSLIGWVHAQNDDVCSNFYVMDNENITKFYVRFLKSVSYLTGVTTAELNWHLRNMSNS